MKGILESNHLINRKTALAIDQRVEKILKELGNPEPPLQLADVRQLLKLDLGYYSSDDDSWLREKVHHMKVAGKEVIETATTILAVVKKLGLKGILLGERRRILLDSEVPTPKHRWNEAHEITHDILPWHEGIAHGDPETTLSPACNARVEAEANYGAGRLLFLGRQFEDAVRSSPCSFDLVQKLHRVYGNTMTSTLWRMVELSLDARFGLISKHPNEVTISTNDDIRYFVRSLRFASELSAVDGRQLFDLVREKCSGRRGPIGEGEVQVTDDRGDTRHFSFETFYNGHDALTLAVEKVAMRVA